MTLHFLPLRALPSSCLLPLKFLRTDRFLLNTSLLMKWQVSDNKLSWQDTSDLLRYSDSGMRLDPSETASFSCVSTRYSPRRGGDGEQGHQHRLLLPEGTQAVCSACSTTVIYFHYKTGESRCFVLSVEQGRAQEGLQRSAIQVAGGSSWFHSS